MIVHTNNAGSRKRSRMMSEINVTPMVDVMLVLLIIFMITSPMLVAGIEVELPKTDSAAVSGNDKPLEITINKRGEIFLIETKIEKTKLVQKLKAITKGKNDKKIFVRGDKNIAYGEIIDLMAVIYNAGFTKVALVSDIKQ